jgi:hypothetical protein
MAYIQTDVLNGQVKHLFQIPEAAEAQESTEKAGFHHRGHRVWKLDQNRTGKFTK